MLYFLRSFYGRGVRFGESGSSLVEDCYFYFRVRFCFCRVCLLFSVLNGREGYLFRDVVDD